VVVYGTGFSRDS
jgi:hypothetical protein